MTLQKPPDWASGQWIAMYGFTLASALSWGIFVLARNDHDMKLLAIGAVISTSSTLIGTASTILVGKPNAAVSSSRDLSDLPKGAVVTDKSTVQVPPIVDPDATKS